VSPKLNSLVQKDDAQTGSRGRLKVPTKSRSEWLHPAAAGMQSPPPSLL